jgi:4-amino-4-deoxy-L-arabinose transferase-like glycosyltransferase
VLRLANLWSAEPPLFSDELEQYVSVHSIATTGADVDGKLEPFLYSRVERNPPLYGIAGYLSTRVFGNDPFGWRFPAAIFGLIAILMLYRIVLELTRRRDIALVAALFLAIEPMAIHFSRIGWEPATVLPVLLGALAVLLAALRDERGPPSFPLLLAAAVLIGITPYTYPASFLYAVVLGGGLFAVHPQVFRDAGNRLKLAASAALALLIAAPGLAIGLTDPLSVRRGRYMFTFGHGVNAASLSTFAHNYAAHFSWRYLFLSGTNNGLFLHGYGALYWWFAPLLLAGLIFCPRYVRSPALCYWLAIWLVAYPLAGALTNDGTVPHPARTIAGLPLFAMFAAFGLFALLDAGRRYRPAIVAAVTACAAVSLWSFCAWYFNVYPVASAEAWESGAREAFAEVRAHESGYRTLCLIDFNPFHVVTLERYYLPDTKLHVIEGETLPECAEPATLILSTHPVALPGFAFVSVSRGLDGRPFAVLEARANGE